MIPMIDMARLLAERGVRVTFITTAVNASRITPIIDRVHQSHLPINFIELPFPAAEAGLPEGCKNWDLIPSKELYKNFFDALYLLRNPLEQHLKDLNPRPTCMINDMFNAWTTNVAKALNIRRLVFHGPSCIYLFCTYALQKHNIYEKVTDDAEEVIVPDLPTTVRVSIMHAPRWLNVPGFKQLRDEVLHAEETADGVVMNTFDDLEPMFVEAYKKMVGKDVWIIGPLCLYDKDFRSRIVRGNKLAAVDQDRMLS
ncbi:hypothetical protein J5N97_006313 [Dioscorea zingiberensis]|uniref:Glycosyltransferase N-terminal domain-containing protein n=1 Tax=Dioscorea zingiberensis TaxID=325984 RepID=A0A9D5DC55_9LILI|nr:hypothetical protein J5N97_006313 [Dioscorea zingiberensis]